MSKKNQIPPDGAKDDNTREAMQEIGHAVHEKLPEGWGFIVMAYPFDGRRGRMNYVSNGKREDVIQLMLEFIAKSESAGIGDHV